jgi:hypothetical protein
MVRRTLISALLLFAAAAGATACSDVETTPSSSSSSSSSGGGAIQVSSIGRRPRIVDKIDLLLMIDNSRSMVDKQLILADAVPSLVKGLVNPTCIEPVTGIPAPQQPVDPFMMCAPGFERAFKPVLDIHIGIISSSLGGHGADACPVVKDTVCPTGMNASNNDAGHLLSRKDPCSPEKIGTYQDKGFLAWDPAQKLMPPGEKEVGDASQPGSGIVPKLRDMVIGTGQIGCGYEAQLESWYRFLIDPQPSKDIAIQDGNAVPTGTDEVLLDQRKAFLRPSSLLAIVMLTDENDCSLKESGASYLAAQQRDPVDPVLEYHLPRPRAVCATNPNDPCCLPCGSAPGTCPPDPSCGPPVPPLSELNDDVNLRCFDQKRRFGIDFLYPIDRYTNALTKLKVPNRDGTLVDNPLYASPKLNGGDGAIRDPSMVFIAGIVGVPWQLVARQSAAGSPDLVSGLDFNKKPTGGYKTFEELSVKDNSGASTWDRILGDPAAYVPPKDPHMIESSAVRAPLSTTTLDPYNGHEYTIAENDDLQFACIFDLPEKRDCLTNFVYCDCDALAAPDNPLCDATIKTDQIKAKSHPSLRELALLKSVGPQGIVASVCPAQLKFPGALDYGYQPAINALIERAKTTLQGCGAASGMGGPCEPPPCDAAKTCLDAATHGGADKLCAASAPALAYDGLSRCACSGACSAACGAACSPVSPAAVTAECQTCLNDAQSGCGAELGACAGQ